MYLICVVLSLPFRVWWWSFPYIACKMRDTLTLLLSQMRAAFYLYVHVRILIHSVWIGCMSEVDRRFKHSIRKFQYNKYFWKYFFLFVWLCMCHAHMQSAEDSSVGALISSYLSVSELGARLAWMCFTCWAVSPVVDPWFMQCNTVSLGVLDQCSTKGAAPQLIVLMFRVLLLSYFTSLLCWG